MNKEYIECYEVDITNSETGRTIEMEIADLKALREILESFDETKIDFELHRKQKEKVIKIKLQVIDMNLKEDIIIMIYSFIIGIIVATIIFGMMYSFGALIDFILGNG